MWDEVPQPNSPAVWEEEGGDWEATGRTPMVSPARPALAGVLQPLPGSIKRMGMGSQNAEREADAWGQPQQQRQQQADTWGDELPPAAGLGVWSPKQQQQQQADAWGGEQQGSSIPAQQQQQQQQQQQRQRPVVEPLVVGEAAGQGVSTGVVMKSPRRPTRRYVAVGEPVCRACGEVGHMEAGCDTPHCEECGMVSDLCLGSAGFWGGGC
mgnify:CR=1 FL=1